MLKQLEIIYCLTNEEVDSEVEKKLEERGFEKKAQPPVKIAFEKP
jgi:hypothetical protein